MEQPIPSGRPVLEPMTFFGILERTFAIYRDQFWTLFKIVAVVGIPVAILQYILIPNQSLNSLEQTTNGALMISNILNFIQAILVYSALTYAASESLFGRRVSMGEAYGAIRNRFGTVGCGMILFSLLIVIFFIGVGILFGFLRTFAVLFIGPVLFFFIAASPLLVPVLTLESIGVGTGIPRAYGLGKQRFWTIVGIGVVFFIVGFIILFTLISAGGLLIAGSGVRATVDPLNPLILMVTIIGALAQFVLTPLTPIATTLIYYDVRVRNENLNALLEARPADTRLTDLESPVGSLGFTGQDIRNILILTGITVIGGILLSNTIMAFINQLERAGRSGI
ncbi:MAG: hypothetical protein JNJ78_17380 [Anaerolineae bacterium]|nr:hypothetical protein [Anaerolineae bacterium]